MVPHDIDLLNLSGFTFGKDQFQVNTVTWQRGNHRFNRRTVFTDAVVEIFQTFFNAGKHCTVQSFAYTHTRSLKVLLQHVVFYRLVTRKGNTRDRRTFLNLHDQVITITQHPNIFEVAGRI